MAGATFLASCREAAAPPSIDASISPLCQIGCLEQDPNPWAPGIFLGSGVTLETCFDQSDADQDGLGDFCEKNLASAFAPELRYWNEDYVDREPHWAARPVWTSPIKVLIAYLISYYRDNGSDAGGCSLPFAPSSCYGHNGDSEVIYLLVKYVPDFQHWVLDSAFYSQHEGEGVYGSAYPSDYPRALYYPSHPGAYPRTYVAEGKHANYASVRECDRGGTAGSDSCDRVNTSARVAAGEYLNVGSSTYQPWTPDCVASSNPSYQYYGAGRLECYWSGARFRGWIPDSVGGDDSDPYGPKLLAHGF